MQKLKTNSNLFPYVGDKKRSAVEGRDKLKSRRLQQILNLLFMKRTGGAKRAFSVGFLAAIAAYKFGKKL
jgi:hypothetical protein